MFDYTAPLEVAIARVPASLSRRLLRSLLKFNSSNGLIRLDFERVEGVTPDKPENIDRGMARIPAWTSKVINKMVLLISRFRGLCPCGRPRLRLA